MENIECQVAIIRHHLDKTQRSGEDFLESWFCHQNTPRSCEGMSPAHLFYRRIIKNPLLPQLADGYDETASVDAVHANKEKKKLRKKMKTKIGLIQIL